MSQSVKGSSSNKMKKSSKDREKRKSTVGSSEFNCNSSINEKSSSSLEKFAALTAEHIKVAAEHITLPELLSEESCELLAEDLNYKLRYIIHQASNRAIISNRTAINFNDINETFEDLNIDKVYGATSNPVWINFGDQNYLCLDDTKIDIMGEIDEELVFSQPADPIITKTWLPESEECNKSLRNYFKTLSEAVISNDIDLRKMALQNISSNPNIGSIIDWFYRLGYMLLSKDITYDSLTLYALDLIETLEMSPLGNTGADEKQLKLLVRLILQRLLKSYTNLEILKPMCWILAILCRRYPLKKLVLTKLIEKLPELPDKFLLPLLMIINALGIDAITSIFLKNETVFLSSIEENWASLYRYTLMETYFILYKNGLHNLSICDKYVEIQSFLIILYRPLKIKYTAENREMDFIGMKKQCFKTIRKIEVQSINKLIPYDSVFENLDLQKKMLKLENQNKLINHTGWKRQSHSIFSNVTLVWKKSYDLKQKLDNFRKNTNYKKQTHIEIGKTSVLLKVLRNKTILPNKCYDHSLFSYNL